MSAALWGRIGWELERDKEGHRDYTIRWLVKVSSPENDGPETVLGAAGLPVIGAAWTYGNDNDPWALCLPTFKCSPVLDKEKGEFWTVEQNFSTRPLNRCQDASIDNPLNEPATVGGTFVKFTKEAMEDKDGNPLHSSSHEPFRGKLVERDDNRPTVLIGFNILVLPLTTAIAAIDTLNDATLWGIGAGGIKMSNMRWDRKLYGTCTFYYTMNYDFEISWTGWKRRIIDEGTKVLCPGGTATNPKHFAVNKDLLGGHGKVLLDGAGLALSDSATPYVHEFQIYASTNFLLLGVPTSL